MNNFKITILVFLAITISRFVPHPPNFTSLLCVSFYIPAIFGISYILPVLFSFIFTDFFFGFHNLVLFTWGSVIIIGLISKYFYQSFKLRVIGAILSSFIFYLLTNYGVWILGGYEFSIKGLLTSYTMAIPFFKYTILSTLIFSSFFEIFIFYFKEKKFFKKYFFYRIN